uniref:Uncharacterized protein n=1 Tax=Oryza sativa subsp. japonica TaxID=39947 RepID=Q10RV5_ORYSJ|nr:hypothetical protein LOC_Os03g05120 [Oryza sativa Japonica Group]
MACRQHRRQDVATVGSLEVHRPEVGNVGATALSLSCSHHAFPAASRTQAKLRSITITSRSYNHRGIGGIRDEYKEWQGFGDEGSDGGCGCGYGAAGKAGVDIVVNVRQVLEYTGRDGRQAKEGFWVHEHGRAAVEYLDGGGEPSNGIGVGDGEKDGRARDKDDERGETGRRRLAEEDNATCRGSLLLHAVDRALWPLPISRHGLGDGMAELASPRRPLSSSLHVVGARRRLSSSSLLAACCPSTLSAASHHPGEMGTEGRERDKGH